MSEAAHGFDGRESLWSADSQPPAPRREREVGVPAWQAEGADKASIKAFMRWLIEKRYLTPYQATLLTNGYADNFFLGTYKILDRLGKGRMAGVYRAVHPSGQVVAIKVLPPSKALEPQTLARFQREAQLATQLVHQCIVRTFHHGESNGLHYLVMEYLEGETLEAILQTRGKLPPREAVRIGFLTCLGLQHIHEKGMVHRDLKPGNLMISPAPGTAGEHAAVVGEDSRHRPGPHAVRSETQGTAGRPDRRGHDPRHAGLPRPRTGRDARKVDIRADLYSLGCALYHMLSGQPPFPDTNPVQQILRHAQEAPKPLTDLKVETPAELNQIVARLLAKEPAQRYQTPAQAADALRIFLGGEADAMKAKAEPQEMQRYLEALKKGPEAPPASDATVAEASPMQFPLPAQVGAPRQTAAIARGRGDSKEAPT